MPPAVASVPSTAVDALRDWLATRERLFVLTGAGCSTASGIPDYRDEDGAWKRTPPVTFQAFTGDDATRRRYWARSFVGWPRVAQARPNGAHEALARFERSGRLALLLTQNVDGLHQRAGNTNVVDLHGRIDTVRCLECGLCVARSDVQQWLAGANPHWHGLDAGTAPDGDADLEHVDFNAFEVPGCPRCAGMLKPDVVFFGENVPAARVQDARMALERSDGLLVVGSSLMVYSGFRFVRLAYEASLGVAILTRGVTRADALASFKLEADCSAVLPQLLDR